jgi:hypothetical protein
MAALPWITYLQRMVGRGHPTLSDTLNTPLRTLLSQSGYDPDASPFPGLMGPVFNVKAFGAVGDGVTDDTAALVAAHAALPATGGILIAPPGVYRFSSFTVTKRVIVAGSGMTDNAGVGVRAATVFLKFGSATGFSLEATGCQLRDLQVDGDTGNSGTGVHVKAGQCRLANVTVTSQGGDGVLIGSAGADANIWQITNLVCTGNGGHGFHIHEDGGGGPNANAGTCLGYNGKVNGGDGLRVDNAIDNQFFGVVCQQNTGQGVHLVGAAAKKCAGNTFWFPYTESNTAGEVLLDANSNFNVIFGYRSNTVNDAIVNNGTNNLILGHGGSVVTGRLFRSIIAVGAGESPLAAELLRIVQTVGGAVSGYWDVYKDGGTRQLIVQLNATGATPADVIFRHGTGGIVDIRADGGFRQSLDGWYQENVAASQTDVVMTRLATSTEAPAKWIAPRAGSVTGVWVKANTPRTAGTLTIKVFRNGAQLGTLTAVLDGANTTFKATTLAKDTITFVAGDELETTVTTDAGWLPVTADIRTGLEVET